MRRYRPAAAVTTADRSISQGKAVYDGAGGVGAENKNAGVIAVNDNVGRKVVVQVAVQRGLAIGDNLPLG